MSLFEEKQEEKTVDETLPKGDVVKTTRHSFPKIMFSLRKKQKAEEKAIAPEPMTIEKVPMNAQAEIEKVPMNAQAEEAVIEPLPGEKIETKGSEVHVLLYGQQKTASMTFSTEVEEKLAEVYNLIFRYGLLSHEQIEKMLPVESAQSLWEMLNGNLALLEIQGKTFYLHSERSLTQLGYLAGISFKKLLSKVLFCDAVDTADVPIIAEQNEILLILEMLKKTEVYDWISSHNPRKKRMIKIPVKNRKHETLQPGLAVILKSKELKYGLIFDTTLSNNEVFFQGERKSQYATLLKAYHAWLSDESEVERWIKKRKLYISHAHIGVALLLSTNQNGFIDELLEICETSNLITPIFLAEKKSFVSKPLACWQSNSAAENVPLFLKIKRKVKGKIE